MTNKIPLIDLVAQYHSIQPEIDAAIRRVLESGQYILGPEVKAFEEEAAEYLGVNYGVGVASGTDALILTLRAMDIGPGDEVIVPAYTFFATVGAVLHVGATPAFVDIEPKTYCIDVRQIRDKITEKTKAIIPVHLYGHPAEMDPIMDLARENGLKVIEDNAQAFGAAYKGRKTGSFGEAACLSFFPSKNLGGYGDGGMVVTNDPEIAERVRRLRTHGWKQKYYPEMLGYNSRLDALQAAVLRVKRRYIDEWNEERRFLAGRYSERLADIGIGVPQEGRDAWHVYHLYVIRSEEREFLRKALEDTGIASDIYYPQPAYLAEPCQELGYVQGDFPEADRASDETLAIPLHPDLTETQLDTVLNALQNTPPVKQVKV